MSVALETGLAPPPSGLPPTGNLAPRDVETLADALLAYHAEFAPLFRRAEQRHWALQYLQGQLLDLERKSIEPMALALADGDVQAMQQFISVGAWDAAWNFRLYGEGLFKPGTTNGAPLITTDMPFALPSRIHRVRFRCRTTSRC